MSDHAQHAPRVLFATSEVAPWAKTGGLADVSASLPAALVEAGAEVRLVVPGYPSVLAAAPAPACVERVDLPQGRVEVLASRLGQVPVYIVACPPLFDRPGGPYTRPDGSDWPDNAERFAGFSRAVAHLATQRGELEFAPDVVHLNDWQTSLAAVFLNALHPRPGIVFTIHNLQYQGLFSRETFERLQLPETLWRFDRLEFHGQLSFLKGGLTFADRLTTVSPTYAREIQTTEHGWGLDGVLRHRRDVLSGILNGIDERIWHPAHDRYIPAHYGRTTLHNKTRNKLALCDELGLVPSPAPLLGVVSRLATQKGIDLILEIADDVLAFPAQLVVLGAGDPALEASLQSASDRQPRSFAYARGFDERLAHLIEAGADIFLMPSRFEPCGLNQMYSLTYGTVPVVRATGGLVDSVVSVQENPACGTGFVFEAPTASALLAAVAQAVETYQDPQRWRAIQRRGMEQDFSWVRSAGQYLSLYRELTA